MREHFGIVCLFAAVVVVASSSASARPQEDSVTERAPSLSGIYIDALRPATCLVALNMRAGRALALYVTQTNNKMTMRVAPSAAYRVLPIERRESVLHSPSRRNGLARWEGDALVVETAAPASPLWGEHEAAVPGSKLTESFTPSADAQLIYRTWYTPPNHTTAQGPFELRLAKCKVPARF